MTAAAPAVRAGVRAAWGAWLAAAASLTLHIIMALRERVVWGDEPFYLWLGQNWLHGRGYQFLGFSDVHHPPGYPVLTALVSVVTGSAEAASTLIYVVCGTLTVFPVYALARRLYGARAATWAALLIGLLPALTAAIPLWGTMTEPPYLLCIALALYLTLRALQDNAPVAYGALGLSLGVAYLLRPEAVWYVAILGALLFLIPLIRRRTSRRWFAGLVLVVAGFLVCYGPYAYYTYLHTGSWMVSEKVGVTFGHAFFLSNNDSVGFDQNIWGLDSTGEQVFFFSDESYDLSMVEMIRENPRDFARIIYRNVRAFPAKLLSVQLLPEYLMLLVVLGLFAAPWHRERLQGEILLMAALLPPLTFLLFFVLERYYVPLLVPLCLWAGVGIEALADWAAGTWRALRQQPAPTAAPVVVRLVLAGLVLVPLLVLQPRAIAAASNNRSFHPIHRAAGLWLREHTPADAHVMARYPAIAYHAERQWAPSPHASLAETLHYARAKGAAYWVVDGWERDWRPYLAPLLDGATPPELELLTRLEQGDAYLLIFRIR